MMGLGERVLRYVLAGFGTSLCYTLFVVALVDASFSAVVAAMLGFVLVQPIGLVMHGIITYPGTLRARAHLPCIGVRFVLTNAAGFGVASGSMALATAVWHASYLWGIALTWMLIPLANFLIYLTWVFRQPLPHAVQGAAPPQRPS
ncbi:MAG: hypothetical protein KJS74_04250 [Rhodospirillales bacterium]|nr:hypothetical protein [Rhodospirillales bacterium]